MIRIIGTHHAKTQFWSDAIRQCTSTDAFSNMVGRFERYLLKAARRYKAKVITEENHQRLVEARPGGSSVAKCVADQVGARHLYCDPDQDQRAALGLCGEDAKREAYWVEKFRECCNPNETSVIFVCGASHSQSLNRLLASEGLRSEVLCDDWVEFDTANTTSLK